MRETHRDSEAYRSDKARVTGRQAYCLEVPNAANSKDISVVSYHARESMATPYEITIEFTHPEQLSRSDYLGRDGHFTITAEDSSEPRVYRGIITRFKRIKKTKDYFRYTIVVVSQMKRLDLLHRSRVYQHQSGPKIIESILLNDKFMDHQFVFRLRREYPVHDFRLQYQMSDLAYIRLLCEQEGIYYYIEQGKHGDLVVFGDDIDHYVYTPELKVPYRENAGLEAGVEAVFALETHTEVVPQSVLVADYNPLAAWERFKDEANVAINDTTTYGQPYVYGTNHLSQDGAQWEAQLRHEAAIAWQVVYHGQSNALELRPGRILRIDDELPDAPSGQVIIEVTHSGGRGVAYSNSYQAIPSDRRFRLKIDESKWPKIHGALSARVTSPNKYPYAYLTKAGHYPVRLDLDFDEWNPGGESIPLRMAKPFAGSLQTGFHFPVLDGTEAVIMARDGDPNKLFISQFHHNSIQSDLIHNQERWMSRNVIRTQSNNKIRMEDWEGEQHIKISTEHSGKSQLNLGHMVDSTRKKRGEGYELRTSGYGAIRAGKGLLVSTDDRPNATDLQLAMQEATKRLDDAYARMEGLAQAARIAKAEAADAKEMQQVLQNQIKDIQQAVMLLSASSSIALVTPDAIVQSAGTNITMTSGGSTDVGVLRKFTVAAGEAISLFAQKMGMKLFASKGKIQIQAQSDEMELTSQQNMTVTSSDGHVIVQARKSVTLTDGAGAYIKLENGNATIGAPNKVSIKMANFQWDGPDSIQGKLPAFATCHASEASAAAAGENSVALT
ncbi:type VI secretion system tip protein VgrG [Caballeronia sp. dw_276]|uniref:type VI secretion system Vgr family protein n=1 Tax=Caballeronia sp. dw_276 TaxID=2719795 RepID=UPI001BD410B7|nr:type VI secretion system tip protein VgrG [Caballeronia sp. dw_276]